MNSFVTINLFHDLKIITHMNCYLLFSYNYKHRKILFYSKESKNYSVLQEIHFHIYIQMGKKDDQLFH